MPHILYDDQSKVETLNITIKNAIGGIKEVRIASSWSPSFLSTKSKKTPEPTPEPASPSNIISVIVSAMTQAALLSRNTVPVNLKAPFVYGCPSKTTLQPKMWLPNHSKDF